MLNINKNIIHFYVCMYVCMYVNTHMHTHAYIQYVNNKKLKSPFDTCGSKQQTSL